MKKTIGTVWVARCSAVNVPLVPAITTSGLSASNSDIAACVRSALATPQRVNAKAAIYRPSVALKALPQNRSIRLCLRIAFRARHEHTDHERLVGYLRPCNQRKSRSAADEADEFAPSHRPA